VVSLTLSLSLSVYTQRRVTTVALSELIDVCVCIKENLMLLQPFQLFDLPKSSLPAFLTSYHVRCYFKVLALKKTVFLSYLNIGSRGQVCVSTALTLPLQSE
jgi:hypothetical protein